MNIKIPTNYENKCEFSPDQKYRYYLQRNFKKNAKNLLVFIMLNPSTANEQYNDPTVERCQNHALNKNYDGMIILNIFAYRTTNPKQLLQTKNPIGEKNNQTIINTIKKHQNIICAWGNHGKILNRSNEIKKILKKHRKKTQAFEITKQNEPKHPLYIPYNKKLKQYT